MDDEVGNAYDRLPKLEDLCVEFIRENVICWRPEDFLGKISMNVNMWNIYLNCG